MTAKLHPSVKGQKPRHYPPRPSRVAEGPGEDMSVTELLDMSAQTSGITHDLLEELTVADLMRLGIRLRQAPA